MVTNMKKYFALITAACCCILMAYGLESCKNANSSKGITQSACIENQESSSTNNDWIVGAWYISPSDQYDEGQSFEYVFFDNGTFFCVGDYGDVDYGTYQINANSTEVLLNIKVREDDLRANEDPNYFSFGKSEFCYVCDRKESIEIKNKTLVYAYDGTEKISCVKNKNHQAEYDEKEYVKSLLEYAAKLKR